MKLQIVSDLHLEFGEVSIEAESNVDVLVLAGDIIVAKYLASPNGDHSKRFKRFFKEINEQFPKAFYVLGNHEHYGGRIENSKKLIEKTFDGLNITNITILEQSSEIYNDVLFLGGISPANPKFNNFYQ